MSIWKYLQNQRTIIKCKSNTRDISGNEYYGCCSGCPFVHGKYGESWRDDKVWCSCPVPIKKGQTIELIEIRKYRTINSHKSKSTN